MWRWPISNSHPGLGLRGRRAELAALDRLLAEARAGQSRVLVLHGEAGVAKTALLDYLQEQASGFRRPARCRAAEAPGSHPRAGQRHPSSIIVRLAQASYQWVDTVRSAGAQCSRERAGNFLAGEENCGVYSDSGLRFGRALGRRRRRNLPYTGSVWPCC